MGISAAYGAIGLSTVCICATLFYIPTFIRQIQTIQNGLTVSMDEFNVMQVCYFFYKVKHFLIVNNLF